METVDRVQIKHKSQRALASCIPGNLEPGIGDPTPAVTSQGSGAKKTNKKVVRPGPRRVAAARVSRGERDRTDYSCLAYRIHSSSPTKRPTPGLDLPVLRSSPWATIYSRPF